MRGAVLEKGILLELKKELSIVEFEQRCREDSEIRFCYNSRNNGKSLCVNVNMVFTAPKVIPNLRTVCFRNEHGSALTLTGVSRIAVIPNKSTGLEDVVFECKQGSVYEKVYLCLV